MSLRVIRPGRKSVVAQGRWNKHSKAAERLLRRLVLQRQFGGL